VSAATIATPTVRAATRRSAFWIVAGLFLLAVAIGTLLVTGASSRAGDPLSATNAAPAGAKAVAEVLRQQGVTVTATSDLAATTAALGDPARTTLFLFDPKGYLGADQYAKLAGLGTDTVLMGPGFQALAAFAPGVSQAGAVAGATLHADCDVPAVRRAGSVSGGGTGFRITGASTATGCLASAGGVFSLIRLDDASRQITVVGTKDAFSNEHVAERGNAALALGLLGEKPHLVWYSPSVSDVAGGAPSLAELTPAWVSPAMILAILVFLAAAFWRGRRLGPLVVENLPVVVRASETMEGRARLYQRSSARLHALDALRIGALERLAAQCGLSHSAAVQDVVAAVADLAGIPVPRVRALLVDEVPATDRDLVRLSDELLRLEAAVRAAASPGNFRKQGE
jgi:hypothetical protein